MHVIDDNGGLGPWTLPHLLLSDDLYRIGYVVADRAQAVRALEGQHGVEALAHAEVHFEAVLPDGSRVDTHLSCALTTGRRHLIEVIQPVSGAVNLWADALKGPGPLLRFHHFGLLTDDLDGVTAAASAHGLPLELSASLEGAWSFAYHRVPLTGHLIEHTQFFGSAGHGLEELRGLR